MDRLVGTLECPQPKAEQSISQSLWQATGGLGKRCLRRSMPRRRNRPINPDMDEPDAPLESFGKDAEPFSDMRARGIGEKGQVTHG